MATVEITLGTAGARTANGQGVAVMKMAGAASVVINSTGVSQATSIAAPTGVPNAIAHIRVSGGNVRVVNGQGTPVADGTTPLILFDGQVLSDFEIQPGDRIAVINA